MEKFVSYDKMSRKEKRKLDSAKRKDWNGVNPATRVVETDKGRYKRRPKYPDSYDE